MSIPEDGYNSDNSKYFVQEITKDRYSFCDTNMYSHQVGWINQGQGSVAGTFLCRFPMNGIKNIKALRIGLGTGNGQAVFAKVLNSVGQPLETSDPVNIDANNSWKYHTFEFDMPPVVDDDFFYVGLVQSPSASDYYPLGYQIEYPRRRGAFYLQTECCDVTEVYDYDHRFVIEAILDTATCIPHFETQCIAGYPAYIRNVFTTEGVLNFTCMNNVCVENRDNYTLHSDKMVSAEKGTHFKIHLTENNPNMMYSIYADWDHDGMFYSPGELLYETENWMPDIFYKKINIPINALTGSTRLRVVARERWFQAAQNPCGSFFDGETRDFMLEVLPPTTMVINGCDAFQWDTLAPVGRNSVDYPIIGIKVFVSGVLDTISATGFDIQPIECTDFQHDVSQVKIWYTPYDSVFSVAMMYGRALLFGSATDLSQTITGNQPLTYGTRYFWVTYDVKDVASLGNYLDASCSEVLFDISAGQVPVTQSPPGRHQINYCIPVFDTPEGWACISAFFTTGGTTNIDNIGSLCTSNSYSYTFYPDQVLTVSTGLSFQYHAMNYDNELNFSLLIDWNGDGDFDEENELISDQYGMEVSGNISVPTDASPGLSRLRVISYYNWFNNQSDIGTGCGWYYTGECEDYSVLIIPGQPVTQSITIPSGWSGFSTYVEPQTADISEMLAPINEQLIIISDFNQVYWPGENLNTYLNGWHSAFGAQIKLSSPGNLEVTGYPASRQFTLNPGWNYIPVLSICNADVSGVFGTLSEYLNYLIVKDIAGTGVYWPEYNINTLNNMVPGKAYFANWDFFTTTQLVFPSCDKSTEIPNLSDDLQVKTPWNSPIKNAQSHLLAIPVSVTKNILQYGDIICAITAEGFCAGSAIFENDNIALTIFGDDLVTREIDGFKNNEPIALKIFRPETNEVFNTIITCQPSENQGVWALNGISVLESISLMGNSIDPTEINFRIYPNPATDKVNLHITGLKEGEINVELFSMEGSKVFEKYFILTAGSEVVVVVVDHCKSGTYTIRITHEEAVFTGKLNIR